MLVCFEYVCASRTEAFKPSAEARIYSRNKLQRTEISCIISQRKLDMTCDMQVQNANITCHMSKTLHVILTVVALISPSISIHASFSISHLSYGDMTYQNVDITCNIHVHTMCNITSRQRWYHLQYHLYPLIWRYSKNLMLTCIIHTTGTYRPEYCENINPTPLVINPTSPVSTNLWFDM